MSVRYPYDPFALPERPDVHPPQARLATEGCSTVSAAKRILFAVAGFAAAVIMLAILLFIPVLVREIGRIDAVVLAGHMLPAHSFAERLLDLFFGTVIVAIAILSFLAASALAQDPRTEPVGFKPQRPATRNGWRVQRSMVQHKEVTDV